MMTSSLSYKTQSEEISDYTTDSSVEIKKELDEVFHWCDDQRNMHADNRERSGYVDPTQLTSITCEELGIPRDDVTVYNRPQIKNASLHMDGLRYECISSRNADPFSPYCLIPLPSPFGLNSFESSCVRRRNERERDRVRCVNDGYLRLKHHLPIENKNKRLSKVETLRCAIKYIRHLECLLNGSGGMANLTFDRCSGGETSASDRSFSTSEDESSSDSDCRTVSDFPVKGPSFLVDN